MPAACGDPLLTRSFPPTTDAPGLARQEIEAGLCDTCLQMFSREAALLTSELVTNAVIHARSVVDVEVYLDDGRVYISVVDFGPGRPAMRTPDADGGGHGLHLVDEIATSWGCEPLTLFGKRVWFELAR